MVRIRTVEDFVKQLRGDPSLYPNITTWMTQDPRDAKTAGFPENMHPALLHGLRRQNITSLYSHQAASWELLKTGSNIVIVTGTASGKSLCYNAPVINDILFNRRSRALYLFPTKALAQDQQEGITSLLNQILTYPNKIWFTGKNISTTYDGDTPSNLRRDVRQTCSIIMTNPDMLHLGILPHHTQWDHYFKNLQFVIIDEIHTYRGVFGSHVSNVLRRLKRIAKFYGSDLQFILTSATIGNPGELAENLIETPVEIIDQDGAPRGKRHFAIYNPPIVNPDIYIRSNRSHETAILAQMLYNNQIQTIIFSQTRRSVEHLLILIQKDLAANDQMFDRVRGYRSGYLAEHRRKLEKGLKSGEISIMVATTALELGIDCGEINAAILDGFPGTISGTWQQVGRAGRKNNSAIAILVVSANPLEQFLARNPDFFYKQNPEKALINPDNILILLEHIKCALFELPFSDGETFGSLKSEYLSEFLTVLVKTGRALKSKGKYFWATSQYPANNVSLRNASAKRYKLRLDVDNKERIIGEVDEESVFWMTHPEAIYLHDGDSYLVEDLDIQNFRIIIRSFQSDYYTKPKQTMEIELLNEIKRSRTPGGCKIFGEVLIHEQVTGYHKIRWGSHEVIESKQLNLPPTELTTSGYLFFFDKKTIARIRDQDSWSNDRLDYGPEWVNQKKKALVRDGNTCQNCGKKEALHVHHKTPLRMFQNHSYGNRLDNLITLCPTCHRRAETSVRICSGLAGLAYIIGNLAPLFLMCDGRDLGVHYDPQSRLNEGEGVLFIYDRISGGLGFSRELFFSHMEIMKQALCLTENCKCNDGCPACVGPGGEFGLGSKRETLALMKALTADYV